MSKTQLVEFIAEETGLTKADSARALEAMMNGVVKGLKDEGKVTLTGFCTFTAKKKIFGDSSMIPYMAEQIRQEFSAEGFEVIISDLKIHFSVYQFPIFCVPMCWLLC